MSQTTSFLARFALLLMSGAANAQMGNHGAHQHDHGAPQSAKECAAPTLACATKVTPAFAADGTLWLAFAAGDRISVTRSTDRGRSFAQPVAVTPNPMQLDWGPDARPKIAVDGQGRVHIAFAIFKDKAFNGQVLYARSNDGGATFEALRPVTNGQESQRFEAIALDPEGNLFAAWLDKRNRVPAAAKGHQYVGAGLAYAWSTDHGATLGETRIARDNTCECCRIGVAFAGPGRPVVAFRNVFDGSVRDHAIMTFASRDEPGPVRRVSVDDWRTDACPHHGPSLAVSRDGTYHVVWFTAGRARKGLFYARSSDAGATFSEPMPIGRTGRQPQRPYVVASGQYVWLAWKEFDGKTSTVATMASADRGVTWSEPRVVASTTDESDHPILIATDEHAFLSWQTSAGGYRFGLGVAPMRQSSLRVFLVAILVFASAAAAGENAAQDVRPFVRGSWSAIRASHEGQAIAVHFWGVTCAPCRVEMPIWGDLVKARPDLKLVTIHAERSPPDQRTVTSMLSGAGLASVESWAFAERFLDPLRFEVDPEWQGEIPMTLLIGRDGKATSIVGSAEPHQVIEWLDHVKSTTP